MAVHAVDHVLNGILAPSISATFGAHSGVAVANQFASIQGAKEEVAQGFAASGQARDALAAKMDTAQRTSDPFAGATGPSILKQGAAGFALSVLSKFDPALAAGIAAVGAVVGGFSPTPAPNVSGDYRSSIPQYDTKGKIKEPDYVDAFNERWDPSGFRAQPAAQAPLIQANMARQAAITIDKLGDKQVESDLKKATFGEQDLAAQLGATMAFEERMMGVKDFKGGPKPPASIPGMGMG